jgi:hypothetical protein
VKQQRERICRRFEVGWSAFASKSTGRAEAHFHGVVASSLNVSLPTAQLGKHTPEEARSGNLLILNRRRWRNRWCRMQWHWLGVVLPTVFGEHQAPVNIVTLGAPERVVLEAKDRHCVVPHHVHQDHLSAASHTTHRTPHRQQLSNAIVDVKVKNA